MKSLQVKHLTDELLLAAIEVAQKKQVASDPYWSEMPLAEVWANRVDVEEALEQFPKKIIRRKLESAIKRGIVFGCACGCRGDFRTQDRANEIRKTLALAGGLYGPFEIGDVKCTVDTVDKTKVECIITLLPVRPLAIKFDLEI